MTLILNTDHDLLKAIAEHRRAIAKAEAELEELKAMAIKRMEERGVDKLTSDEHEATYREVVSNRFDSKSFKADGYEELYKAYTKPSSSMRFNFS